MTDVTQYTPLREMLWPAAQGRDPKPLVVQCSACEMTMWAHGPNALVEVGTDRIYCKACAV